MQRRATAPFGMKTARKTKPVQALQSTGWRARPLRILFEYHGREQPSPHGHARALCAQRGNSFNQSRQVQRPRAVQQPPSPKNPAVACGELPSTSRRTRAKAMAM